MKIYKVNQIELLYVDLYIHNKRIFLVITHSPPVIEPAGFFFIASPQTDYSLEYRNIFHNIPTADLPSPSIYSPLGDLSLSRR